MALRGPSVATIKRLFAVSRNNCAFPDCSQDLVDFDSGKVVGEICHICARSPDGPRYDPDQSDEDRHGFANLVLMCARHHAIIDGDSENHPRQWLIEIKSAHERGSSVDRDLSDGQAVQFLHNSGIVARDVFIQYGLDGEEVSAVVKTVLDHVADPPAERDPRPYLELLVQENAHIDIRGLFLGSGKPRRFPIDQIYIRLTTSSPGGMSPVATSASVVGAYPGGDRAIGGGRRLGGSRETAALRFRKSWRGVRTATASFMAHHAMAASARRVAARIGASHGDIDHSGGLVQGLESKVQSPKSKVSLPCSLCPLCPLW